VRSDLAKEALPYLPSSFITRCCMWTATLPGTRHISSSLHTHAESISPETYVGYARSEKQITVPVPHAERLNLI
jgi:hypothetical protein